MIKKGQIWISAILYILIITVVMTLVLKAGVPILEDLQDKTAFTRTKNTFIALNQHIVDVSNEGTGSQRVVPIEIEKGSMELEDGSLKWDLRTDAKILEPSQEIDLGNLFITSNAEVSAVRGSSTYTLSNTYLTAVFTKCESRTNCTLSSSNLLQSLSFNNPDSGSFTASENFTFEFGSGSWSSSGFSKMDDEGTALGGATVAYFVNNSADVDYSVIEFTLLSNRDFIEVNIR